MGIKILPAEIEDASIMVETGMAAFANDDLSRATFDLDNATEAQMHEYRSWRETLLKQRMEGPGKHWIKAVNESDGRLAGYIGLYDPTVEASDPLSIPMPLTMNIKAVEETTRILQAAKDKHLRGRNDVWYIQSMLVHPDFQGQGVATTLLQRGLELPDRAGQDIYLEGTAAGKRLYHRCGFEDLEELPMTSVNYTLMTMIRHPSK